MLEAVRSQPTPSHPLAPLESYEILSSGWYAPRAAGRRIGRLVCAVPRLLWPGGAMISIPLDGSAALRSLIEFGLNDVGPGCSGRTRTALIMNVKWVVSLTTRLDASCSSTRGSATQRSA